MISASAPKKIQVSKMDRMTPLMQQYTEIKRQYPGALVLFRMGDFYETFNDDAKVASKILGITLTKRASVMSTL